MKKYKLVVFSRPVKGKEEEYNRWYQDHHVPDIVSIPGVVRGQRYKLHELTYGPEMAYPYLCIYDLETDDTGAIQAEIRRRGETGEMVRTDAIAPDIYAITYEHFGEVVTK